MKLSYDDIIKKFISENEIKESSQSHRLTEGAKYKKGQKVQYQLDRGSSKALKPSVGTISKVKMHGKYCQYTIQDGGPVPVWGAEIIGLAEGELTEAKKIKPFDLGYRMNLRRARAEFNKGENIAAVSKRGKGNFKIDNVGDFPKYPTKDWDYAFIVKEGELNEDYSQRARNFRVALRRRLEKMKPGQVIRYGKQFWTAQGKNNFRDSLRNKTFPNGRMTPGQDVVQALKFAVQSDIMKHRGAAGDDMVNAYLKFEGKLTEAKYKVGDTVTVKTGANTYKGKIEKLSPLKIRTSPSETIVIPNNAIKSIVKEGKLNESMIGIQTKANFKPNTLKGALERAGMKGFQMNRLSVTLTALKLDKKDFEKAKKIIDAMPTAKIMTAKESVNEDKDIGHQDDEPNMLKSTALEIMEYGKKLMDKLDTYDDMEEEVDFPNWWQAKLIVSKEYLQKAYHYLDSEEKTEESVNENKFNRPPDGFNWNKARADAKKAVAREKERSKQVEKEKKELLDAIKIFRAKIKKQGRITNARDEEHLKKLIDLYKMKYPTRPDLAKLNEATNLWKHFDAKMKLQDTIMDLEYDMKMITNDLKQLHIDMEQEAEPEGGPKATKYGREIEKLEKEYKKKKAEFKKLMKKLDKMEQY